MSLSVQIQRLPHAKDLALPDYATEQSAGMDLMAAIEQDFILETGQRSLIPTGLAIALAPGFEAQIRPRSGLALKNGIGIVNAPGTIDADYRGEIKVLLINHGKEAFTITRGMRIAQMIISTFNRISWQEVDQLPESSRGIGGFGSTGLHKQTAA